MDASRWQRVRELFDAIADEPASQWLQRLQALSPGDSTVHAEVLAMLAADADVRANPTQLAAQAPQLMQDLSDDAEVEQSDAWLGRRLGAWRIVSSIGRGGMGRVYLAERDDGEYLQQAALKLVADGIDRAEVTRRFRAERQILASLQHPHIAALLDGGVSEEGIPWFALEYVDGDTLTRWCDARRLTVTERLHLFVDICTAVTHAHERLIVHRDLKPGNILVNRAGEVKLLDFGIAKLLDADGDGAGTATAWRAFTPDYAAPEQIRGGVMTTAVDVYALGAILYELLTGRKPYKVRSSTLAAYEYAVIHDEPAFPSGAVTQPDAKADTETASAEDLAHLRNTSPQRLRTQLRGDIDAIVLKALRKEPEARYSSVRQLEDDVHNALAHRTVNARQGGFRYRAGRFVRRYRLATALSAIALLAIATGLTIALWQAHLARVQRDLARAEADKARQVLNFMTDLFERADPGRQSRSETTARDLLDEGVRSIRYGLASQASSRAELSLAMASGYLGLELHDAAEPLIADALSVLDQHDDAALRARAVIQECRRLNYRREFAGCAALAGTAEAALDVNRDNEADLYARVVAERLVGANNSAQYAVIEKEARHALTVLRDIPSHLTIRTTLTGMLSNSLVQQARASEAEALMRPLVESLRRTPNLEPRILADALDRLALTVNQESRSAEMLDLQKEALSTMESLYGVDHPVNLTKMNNLSVAMYRAHRYDEAIALLERVIAMRRKYLPPGHPRLASNLGNLGAFEFERGDAAAAQTSLDEAIRLLDQAPTPPPKELGGFLYWRAAVEFSVGRNADAKRDFERADQTLLKVLTENHPRLLTIRSLRIAMSLQAESGRPATCDELEAINIVYANRPDGALDGDVEFARFLHETCLADLAGPGSVAGRQRAYANLATILHTGDFRLRLAQAVVKVVQ